MSEGEWTPAEYRDYLKGRFLALEPDVVSNAAFTLAWREGHSAGLADVEMWYEEVADLIRLVRRTA